MTVQEMNDRKQELGYSYKDISELSGLPIQTVQKVLGGFTKHPRRDTVEALEKVLAKRNFLDSLVEKNPLMIGETAYKYVANLTAGEKNNNEQNCEGIDYSREYTYEDYVRISEKTEKRMELIDGKIYNMSSPSTVHQLAIATIFSEIKEYIKKNNGDCMPFVAPLDVKIMNDERNVVQPDVFVVCDKSKIERKYIKGAVDLAIEVLSPNTSKRDMTIKRKLYREAGVREYWMVDLESETVIIQMMDENITYMYGFDELIPVGIYEGKLNINLAEVLEFNRMFDGSEG